MLYSCKTNKRARSSIFAPVPVSFIAGGLGLSDLEFLLVVMSFSGAFPFDSSRKFACIFPWRWDFLVFFLGLVIQFHPASVIGPIGPRLPNISFSLLQFSSRALGPFLSSKNHFVFLPSTSKYWLFSTVFFCSSFGIF